jgi:hypothetical protein
MDTHTSTSKRLCDRRSPGDSGQAALVVVIAFTVMLTIFGGVMISSIVNNAPIITQASIQRLAYRAMASGLNAYQNAINANPYLAACNSATNYPNGTNATPQCAGLSYQTWSEVPGTDVGNGVIPEYYKFDNPQQVISSTTNAITYLEVQIVGAAGFPGRNVFYSTIAKFTPQNGFLNAVWWSNYESFDPSAGGSASNCGYFYNQGRSVNTSTFLVGSTPCVAVEFQSGDALYGPVYSNDSLYVGGGPTFTGPVDTADPHCLFVDYASSTTSDSTGCLNSLSPYPTVTNPSGDGFNHTPEPLPTTNANLAATAEQGGCYYQGPTTIALSVVSGVGKMTVVSPDTTSSVAYPGTGGIDQMNLAIDSSSCPTNGIGNLPANGVLYVDGATTSYTGANPFDGSGTTSQVKSNCSDCYYGQSASPDTEGDAFVRGALSGHLTVASYNNVIIDGPITYNDCTGKWVSTASQSVCGYNDATTTTPNDTLGLIANNFVEVNRPVNNVQTTIASQSNGVNLPTGTIHVVSTTGFPSSGSVQVVTSAGPQTVNYSGLTSTSFTGASSGSGTMSTGGFVYYRTQMSDCVPPNYGALCDPATTTGSPTGSQGLTIDATILALNQSFAVDNYSVSGNEGQLTIYGSIQQDARGAVGLSGSPGTGYVKYYLWDPRLTLYGPPFYLTPGTPSWALDSSASTYQGSCPAVPPPEATPSTSQPSWPALGTIPGGWSACVSAS